MDENISQIRKKYQPEIVVRTTIIDAYSKAYIETGNEYFKTKYEDAINELVKLKETVLAEEARQD